MNPASAYAVAARGVQRLEAEHCTIGVVVSI
jgi:hypothetical protein